MMTLSTNLSNTKKQYNVVGNLQFKHFDCVLTRKCVYETLCPQLVSHFQDVKIVTREK